MDIMDIIKHDIESIQNTYNLLDFSSQSNKWDKLIEKSEVSDKDELLEQTDMLLIKALKRFMTDIEYKLYSRYYYIIEMRRLGIKNRYLQFVFFDIAYAIHETSIAYYEDDKFDDYYYDRIDDRIMSSIRTIYKRLGGLLL